ncbi:MAG: hypothetical protein RDU14_00850 [Melioribacteraceae bacterium]|nr:hypothetical protein [Melioribacteraceae bacterium]
MPVAVIKKKIIINPNTENISIELEFKTLLLCVYRIQIKEANSNKIVHDWSGDNTNDQDDKYSLGIGKKNVGRTVWIFLSIIDQTGKGGDYEITAILKQNGEPVPDGKLTTGKKELKPGENKHDYILVAKLIE